MIVITLVMEVEFIAMIIIRIQSDNIITQVADVKATRQARSTIRTDDPNTHIVHRKELENMKTSKTDCWRSTREDCIANTRTATNGVVRP